MKGARAGVAKRIAVVFAACALALVAGECLARRAVPQNGTTPFRTPDVDILPAQLRPNFETLYRGHPVRINSAGYRGPEWPSPDQTEGVRGRVALVGDSFTFGNGVAFEDTLGARLEAALAERGSPALVMNFGVPGYNVDNVAHVVAGDVLEHSPDTVVFVFFANDVEPPLPMAVVDPNAVIDPLFGFPFGSALVQSVFVLGKRWALRFGVDLDSAPRAARRDLLAGGGRARLVEGLERMRTASEAAGARFVVALYPFLIAPDQNPFQDVDEVLFQVASELGLEAVHLGPDLWGERRPERLWAHFHDSHPNGRANGLAAEVLAAYLHP